MKIQKCDCCGGSEFIKSRGYATCVYCRTRYKVKSPSPSPGIALGSDVSSLLEKCRSDPRNASRYAVLILEIDPFNKEALRYL